MAPVDDDGCIEIEAGTRIPFSEISFTAARSSGPGGQHVNKVSTKVTLLFDLTASASLTPDQKERLRERLGNRINRNGILRVSSQEYRSQGRNRQAATDRFAALIRGALQREKPRRPTRKPWRVRETRLRLKKKRGELKKGRSGVPPEEF